MIEAFMWGYWGWGGSTGEFVEAFDAAEAQRGHDPPVFVDVRIRREVRAAGFRGDAFEKPLGAGRYVRLQGLGNEGIAAPPRLSASTSSSYVCSFRRFTDSRLMNGSRKA